MQENTTETFQSTGSMSFPTTPSTITPTVVGATISSSATIPTNPSSALTHVAVAVVTSPTTETSQLIHNATTHLAENDELEYSILAAFSDMETVLLACISTLLPLIFALGIAFGVRHVWRKYRERRDSSNGLPWYRNVCSKDGTSESLHHRPHSGIGTTQPGTQILSAEDLVNGLDGPRYICETEVIEALTGNNVEYVSPGNHTSKNSNGNIITLTLKNNHLIVETEERAVTMEDNNKGKKYQDNGCSFVVEVQPGYQSDEADVNRGSSDDMPGRVTDQQALVHREEIPEDHSCGFENTKLFGSTNTGLSQSDLSICSQGSVNPSYRYGNQLEYDAGHFGYAIYDSDSQSRKLEGSSKWVEFDKSPDIDKTLLTDYKAPSIDKDTSENLSFQENFNSLESPHESGSSFEHQDSSDMSLSTDTVKSNPNLQVNGTTPNKLELMEQKVLNNDFGQIEILTKPIITGAILKEDVAQEDTFQEQQRKLGNGTLTPEHHKAERVKDQKPESSTFVPCHKRTGSIPPRLIEETLELERKKALDIYSQIKTSTKSILPALSPKFELLQNEVSPIEEKES
ncbi:uncharacterized protein LOC122508184 [Leptopilina heterotoma]|uniref:uncharacterized protein LOC122508184 n=1 Tax=Leptopilina heterotoma TaxID=63436 RepID=UPI001CA94B89|nr:uncharacterized protein LOC122508184 [Leptopilina heterotoma]